MANPLNLPPLPAWRGYTAANNAGPAMYSMDGRWYKEGQTINGGYIIGPRDAKTGQLSLLYQGGALPISMAGSSSLPMPEIPTAKQFILGGGAYTEEDLARLAIQNEKSGGEFEQDLQRASQTMVNPTGYLFRKEEFDRIVKNAQKSPYMSDEQKSRIISHEDFQKGLGEGGVWFKMR